MQLSSDIHSGVLWLHLWQSVSSLVTLKLVHSHNKQIHTSSEIELMWWLVKTYLYCICKCMFLRTMSQYQAIHAREFTDLTTKYAQLKTLLTAMWLHHHWTEHMHIFSNLVIRRAWRCDNFWFGISVLVTQKSFSLEVQHKYNIYIHKDAKIKYYT